MKKSQLTVSIQGPAKSGKTTLAKAIVKLVDSLGLSVKVVEQGEAKTDLEVFGNPDLWQIICKTSSKKLRWMKSTKALEIPGAGCLIQVTTQLGEHVAEAVCFAPGVRIHKADYCEPVLMSSAMGQITCASGEPFTTTTQFVWTPTEADDLRFERREDVPLVLKQRGSLRRETQRGIGHRTRSCVCIGR